MHTLIEAGSHEILLFHERNELVKELLVRIVTTEGNIIVISDENTHRHCLPLIDDVLPSGTRHIVTGAGELHKNVETCRMIWEQLLQSGAGRDALILNLGGGMIGDLGGFAAATYKRGVRFIHIPTSLLAMVDASCGGKTGIDLHHYKNMIGLFAFPEVVLVDPAFLETLPAKEWMNGIAEMLKHGLIGNVELFEALSELLSEPDPISDPLLRQHIVKLLEKSIRVKAALVTRDPFEKGERKFLNFGHTLGHAFESYSLKHHDHPLSHGEAVAMGMVCETWLSVTLCGLNKVWLDRLTGIYRNVFQHRPVPHEALSQVMQFVRADKKAEGGETAFALLKDAGSPVMKKGISEKDLYDSVHYYNSLRS